MLPKPYLFGELKDPSHYRVLIGPSGTFCTEYMPTGQVIQSVTPGDGMSDTSMLDVASVVIGLVNVGIGLHNAFSLDRLEEQASDIRGRLASIDVAMGAQATLLGAIVEGQEATIDLLRNDVLAALSRNNKLIELQEVKRFRTEWERARLAYQRWLDASPEGEDVIRSEAEELKRAARNLLAVATESLGALSPEDPQRTPYVVARTLANRFEADALVALGRHGAARKLMRESVEELQRDARLLTTDRTLYELGFALRPCVQTYALLFKGVRLHDDGVPTEVPNLVYGLEDVCAPTSNSSRPATIRLRTIADHQWYVSFMGLDPETHDVHSVLEVPFALVEQVLGAPAGFLGDTAGVRALALPGALEKVGNSIAKLFDLSESVRVRRKSPALPSVTASPVHEDDLAILHRAGGVLRWSSQANYLRFWPASPNGWTAALMKGEAIRGTYRVELSGNALRLLTTSSNPTSAPTAFTVSAPPHREPKELLVQALASQAGDPPIQHWARLE